MRSLLVLAAAALAACAGAGGGPATAAPADPDAAGQRLYRAHCAACHRLRDPSEQTRQGWARAVEHYGPRAHLSGEERRLVLEYLQARAREDAVPARRE
jgi:mono/diheme cytochrome c family protein